VCWSRARLAEGRMSHEIEALISDRRFQTARALIAEAKCAADAAAWYATVDAVQFGSCNPLRALGLPATKGGNVSPMIVKQAYKYAS
jgi:hypothetical protein